MKKNVEIEIKLKIAEYERKQKSLYISVIENGKSKKVQKENIKLNQKAALLGSKAEALKWVLKISTPYIFKEKKILIIGPGASGKTTLAKQLLKIYNYPYCINNDDDTIFKQEEFIKNKIDLIIIDEVLSIDHLLHLRKVSMIHNIDLILITQELIPEFKTENILKDWIKDFKVITCTHK